VKFFKKEETPSNVQPVIEDLISTMAGYDATDEDYSTMVANLKVLTEAKAIEPTPRKISPDTIVIVAANLIGVAAILLFERNNVITSKSMPNLIKPRINN
jgi:hypothetical protein